MHSQIILLSLATRLAMLNGAAASRCSHRPVSGSASVYSTTTGSMSSSISSTILSYTDVAASQSQSLSSLNVATSTTSSGSITKSDMGTAITPYATETSIATSTAATEFTPTESTTTEITPIGTVAPEVTTTHFSTTDDLTLTPTSAPQVPTLPASFNIVRLDANGQESDGLAEPFPHALNFVVNPATWIPLHLDVASGRVLSGDKYLCVGYGTQYDQVGYINLCDGTEDEKRPATCVATSSSSISCGVPKCSRINQPNDEGNNFVVACSPNDDLTAPWNTWYSYNGFGISLLLGPAEYTGVLSVNRLSKLVYTLKEASPTQSQAP